MNTFRFRDFPVYKDALDFRGEIKKLSDDFPENELYGLTSQINRAAISIVLNIAEESERYSDLDFSRFLNNSIASLAEVAACLDIALNDSYISTKDYEKMNLSAEGLSKQLRAFCAKVRNDKRKK